MGPMGWLGLLRVVDLQELLTAQPVLAAALDKAQRSGGTKSPDAKALREGYQLLAKTLWTRRASIQRVHDLARRGARADRALRSSSQHPHSRMAPPNSRAWSRIRQWSCTTSLPAAAALEAATSFRMPSCIQMTFAGPLIA